MLIISCDNEFPCLDRYDLWHYYDKNGRNVSIPLTQLNITVEESVECSSINSEKPFNDWIFKNQSEREVVVAGKGQKVCHLFAPDITRLMGYSYTKHAKRYDIRSNWTDFKYTDCVKPGAKEKR